MNAQTEETTPGDHPAAGGRPTPSKPVQTPIPTTDLVAHYNSQLEAYNAAIAGAPPTSSASPMVPIVGPETVTKEDVILLIRKQNFHLKRFIRPRAVQLLQEVVSTNDDGRTVGHSYDDVLAILAREFPEGSTSKAALRWYVVHLWSEADEEGLARPKMPQIRPRSVKPKES